MEIKIILGILILTMSLAGYGKAKEYFSLKDDNAFEEMVEDYIEDELGVEIDLTPDSYEGYEVYRF